MTEEKLVFFYNACTKIIIYCNTYKSASVIFEGSVNLGNEQEFHLPASLFVLVHPCNHPTKPTNINAHI